jgi:hypothetical protein
LWSSTEVHDVIQTTKKGQVPRVTSVAAEVGGGPTVVVEVEILACQLMECRLGGTLVEHPSTIIEKS